MSSNKTNLLEDSPACKRRRPNNRVINSPSQEREETTEPLPKVPHRSRSLFRSSPSIEPSQPAEPSSQTAGLTSLSTQPRHTTLAGLLKRPVGALPSVAVSLNADDLRSEAPVQKAKAGRAKLSSTTGKTATTAAMSVLASGEASEATVAGGTTLGAQHMTGDCNHSCPGWCFMIPQLDAHARRTSGLYSLLKLYQSALQLAVNCNFD